MNTPRLKRIGLRGFVFRSSVIAAFLILSLIGVPISSGQNAKKEPSVKKEATQSGYLSKAPPAGLRFAPPPKPPVAYLPPLPITQDPQPVFSGEFAPPTDFPVPPPSPKPVAIQPASQIVPFAELASTLTNRQGKIPPTPVEFNRVSPQMLVRFFQNGKPEEVQLLIGDPVSFRVPEKENRPSSTAGYELK
jgi:hypothetical protein